MFLINNKLYFAQTQHFVARARPLSPHRWIVKRRPPEGRANSGSAWSLSWPQFEAVIATLFADDESSAEAALQLVPYLRGGGSGASSGSGGVPRATRFVRRFCHFFERCGCVKFATDMATTPATDLTAVCAAIEGFSASEVVEAASFHGDIGESPVTLDPMARAEQSAASGADAAILAELRALGAEYIERHGVKFLVSAKGKSASELLSVLKGRIDNPTAVELDNARTALWEITRKRLDSEPADTLHRDVAELLAKHTVVGGSFCVAVPGGDPQSLVFGDAVRGTKTVTPECLFEIASLSKSVGSAFAIQYVEAFVLTNDDL